MRYKQNRVAMCVAVSAAYVISCSIASPTAFVPQSGFAASSKPVLQRKKTPFYVSRFDHLHVGLIQSSRRRGRSTLDTLAELSYKTTPDNDYLASFGEKGDMDKDDSIEEMQAVLDGLETQKRELITKLVDLESSERQIEQEQYRVRNALCQLKEEASVDTDTPFESLDQNTPTKIDTLNGEVLGGGNYLLAGEPKETTSGRSCLWAAYRSSGKGLPKGKKLAVKISSDTSAMEREHQNYWMLPKNNRFVNQLDFFPVYSDTIEFGGETIPIDMKIALVMERGDEDLQSYLKRKGHGMVGDALRKTAMMALRCLGDIHSAGLVWTDMKTQNFVVFQKAGTEDITIKGIDLESAVSVKGHPIDYCPEVCPPELARACMLGKEVDFVLEYSYDIWSLGMLLYELSTGRGFYDGKPLRYIVRMLGGALPGYKPSLDNITDKHLAELIALCLQDNPSKRPSVAEVLKHPYFLG